MLDRYLLHTFFTDTLSHLLYWTYFTVILDHQVLFLEWLGENALQDFSFKFNHSGLRRGNLLI